MPIERVLITVKTYPNLSTKYDELVCTAGLREDGSWIRIFPMPFRQLPYDQQYKKYDWIEIDLSKNGKDFRTESFRPTNIDKGFDIVGHIDTKNDWAERKAIVLNDVYTNLGKLFALAKEKGVYKSLVVFKPSQITNFTIEPCDREWSEEKIQLLNQGKLFDSIDKEKFTVVKKLPYKFSYTIIDDAGRKSTMMIEDWEIGQLYWNSLARNNNDEVKACEDVKKKYFDEFLSKNEIYLFLGTTFTNHLRAPNPFIIIGIFYPPKQTQLSLAF